MCSLNVILKIQESAVHLHILIIIIEYVVYLEDTSSPLSPSKTVPGWVWQPDPSFGQIAYLTGWQHLWNENNPDEAILV